MVIHTCTPLILSLHTGDWVGKCYTLQTGITPSSNLVRGQMLTRVLVTKKPGQIFTRELKVCDENSIIIGQEVFLRRKISQISLWGSPVCSQGFIVQHFVLGRFTLVWGLILLQFCHWGNHWGRMYLGT